MDAFHTFKGLPHEERVGIAQHMGTWAIGVLAPIGATDRTRCDVLREEFEKVVTATAARREAVR